MTAGRCAAVALVLIAASLRGDAAPAVVARAQRDVPAEIILYNGRIVTVDAAFSYAEAVAIRGGRFIAVGSTDAVNKYGGSSTRRIDLRGRTAVPGLSDNHLHSAGGGPGLDLSRARSIGDVLAAISARIKEAAPGRVVVSNRDWHEGQLKEQRLPLRRDIDRVAPETAVVLIRGGHEYILNTAALERWKIDEHTPEPEGGRISRYEDGSLNGELVDRAKNLVPAADLGEPAGAGHDKTLDRRIAEKTAEYQKLNAAGLTSVRHAGIDADELALLREMQKRGLLTLRVNALLTLGAAGGHTQDEGDDWLRVGGIKLMVDGGFEGGWMRDPYAEPYGDRGRYRGLSLMPLDTFTSLVRTFNRAGWRVFTHAVGDAAIDQVLAGYETANADKSIVGRRWGIEHAFIAQADQFPRMKKLGLGISAQHHLYLAAPSLVKYWGAQRAARTTPMRALLDAGLPVSIGTDAAVVPYPPLWAIYHFVTRDTISAGVVGADQRVTREEALRANTMGGAWLTFEERTKGSIEPGKLADLVVLSEDIMTAPEKRIEQMHVQMTMVGGRVVYERPGS
jgi:predicted amidohydrolase YtcJ